MGIEISLLHVRRSILIQATPQRVWEEFTSFDRLKAWFGRGHTLEAFEPRLGAEVRLSIQMDGKRAGYGGRVLVFEENREVTFESQWEDPEQAFALPTLMTIRLTALYDATHVELFHHGFERLGAAAADNLQGYEEGWTINHLEALRGIVEA